MLTGFMGISHGSSWQHVTIWSIFGYGRCLGMEPEAVHIGQGGDPVTRGAQPLIGRFSTIDWGTVTWLMLFFLCLSPFNAD